MVEKSKKDKMPTGSSIEDTIKEEKGLLPNVDFYSAPAYYILDIPISIYTPIFVLARIVGWSAHIIEQLDNNRLIRPRSEYLGEAERTYVPIAKRS